MSAATITLLFLLFAVVMFVFEKIPLGVTSMIVCIGLVVTGVLDVKTAFAGFIDSNVILFVAMFIVGGALFETGMANKIGGIVTHFAKSERSLIVAIMVIVGLMSGVLSNTGTAAVLIPVVIGIAAKSGYARSKLLMPLVFAAAMGGNLSLIGAPGNLIAQSALGEIGMSFGFLEYAIVGLPILAVGILFYATLGMKLLPNHPVSDDDSFGGEQNFSNVPKWKQMLSLVILVLTLLGMIKDGKKILTTPVSAEDLKDIHIGDVVYLNGDLTTCRDVAHRRLVEEGRPLPVDVKDAAIFHAGPIIRPLEDDKFEMVSVGPTTSMRMEKFEYEFVQKSGVRVIVGKGGMGPNTERACKEFGAIHCVFPAGNAVVAATEVEEIVEAQWRDLGMPETLWHCHVNEFGPLIVSIDAEGRNLFEENKVIFNQRKDKAVEEICKHVGFIK